MFHACLDKLSTQKKPDRKVFDIFGQNKKGSPKAPLSIYTKMKITVA